MTDQLPLVKPIASTSISLEERVEADLRAGLEDGKLVWDAVQEVLEALDLEELRELYQPVLESRAHRIMQNIQRDKTYGKRDRPARLERAAIDGGSRAVTIERGAVRVDEKKALKDLENARSCGLDPSGAYAQLISLTFVTDDGREVYWVEATVEDHDSRLGLLRRQQKGLASSIRLHEQAVSDITKTPGAETLQDVIDYYDGGNSAGYSA